MTQADLLTANLLVMLRGLRQLGFDIGAADLQIVMSAISKLGWDSESTCRAGVESLVVRRPEQIGLFRAAWYQFWLHMRRNDAHASVSERTLSANIAKLRENRHRHPQVVWLGGDSAQKAEPEAEEAAAILRGGASAHEVLRQTDFAKLTDQEQEQLWRLQGRLQPLWKSTRRRKGATVGDVDFAQTVRKAASRGEWLPLMRSQKRVAQRSVVLLCDVSGSMEAYSRMLLRFAHCLMRAGVRLEVFLFSTRLTRVTTSLLQHNPDRAMAEVGAKAFDFAGGTRMVDALKTFRRDYARTVLRKSPVFLLATDGFDTGDREELDGELRRLKRLTRRVLWLNPMTGDENYRPEAEAALILKGVAHDMLKAHNWASLEEVWNYVREAHQHLFV